MASIYKRGHMWYSRFSAGGRPIREPLSTNEREAKALLTELVESYRPLRAHAGGDTSWRGWKAFYFRTTDKMPNTLKRERAAISTLEAYKKPRSLFDVTPALLAEWKAHRSKKGRGRTTINRDIRAIRAVMKHAEKMLPNLRKQNWSAASYYTESGGRVEYLTAEQLRELAAAVKGKWLTVVRLGAQAGLRRGEIRWLSWEDVDFALGRIHLTPKHDAKGRLLWKPKNHDNPRVKRFTPMRQSLRAYLEALPRDGEWVLGAEPPSEAVMTAVMAKTLRKLGLPGSIHVLRHTYCSHLASANVSPRKIQELARHASLRATEIYMHLSPGDVLGDVEKGPEL